jgi:hypothetical protein
VLVTLVILACLGIGIGVGIGIGAGIWKGSDGTNEASLKATCPEGEHVPALNTYFVTTSSVNVSELPERYNPAFGDFLAITIPKSSLPPTIPFVKTSMTDGAVYQDVLNSTDFFDMWGELSKKADPENGTFAMPGLDEAHWCFRKYKDQFDPLASGKGLSQAPANAMLVFESDSRETFVADIFSVEKDADAYTLHARLAPANATLDNKEGVCHLYQSVYDPHYHHRSSCLQILPAVEITATEAINGKGMTAFIRLTPAVGLGVGELVFAAAEGVGDLIAAGGAEAGGAEVAAGGAEVAAGGGEVAAGGGEVAGGGGEVAGGGGEVGGGEGAGEEGGGRSCAGVTTAGALVGGGGAASAKGNVEEVAGAAFSGGAGEYLINKACD